MIPPFDERGELPPGIHGDRRAQKQRFGGEAVPADAIAVSAGTEFLDFFQLDRAERAKGFIEIDLESGL